MVFMGSDPKLLQGCRVLVVEDEYYQGREAKALLEGAGAAVLGPTVDEAVVAAWLQADAFDLALIDLDLGRGLSFSMAHTLQRHSIPFLILTGYDKAIIPPELAHIPFMEKPADIQRIIGKLRALWLERGE